MNGFLRVGIAAILALIVPACRENQHATAKPHGLDLPGLPIASVAPVFDPEHGHYAEVLLRDGHWHACVDGKFEKELSDLSQMSGFLKCFKDRVHTAGRHPVLLISAEGQAPLSDISIPIRAAVGCGIDKFFLHVRPSSAVGRASPCCHSLALDFTSPASRFAKYTGRLNPLAIAILTNGSVRRYIDGALTRLDDSEAPGDLPGLDSVLSTYAERVRSDDAAPLVYIYLGQDPPYQRLIDVLCRLHFHGLESSFFTREDL